MKNPFRRNKPQTEDGASKKTDDGFGPKLFIVYVFMAISFVGLLVSAIAGVRDVPYIALPLIVIFSVVFFVSSLAVISAYLREEVSGVKVEALGLPTGSVRALIALSLIVIFAIMVIFMYGHLEPVPREIISNITTIHPNGTITGSLNSTTIFTEPSQAQREFSLQTLTTVSTLVVALTSFYFGSKAVKTAIEATTGGKKKALTIEYKGEPKVEKGKEFEITVKTTPEDQATVGKVVGDDEGTLKQTGNQFKYKPSEKASGTVDLKFAPAKHTEDDWQVLQVTLTEPAAAKEPPEKEKSEEEKKAEEEAKKKGKK